MPLRFGVDLPDVSRTIGFLLASTAFFLALHWIPQLAREEAERECYLQQAQSREAVRLAVNKAWANDPDRFEEFQQWQADGDFAQFDTFQGWKDARETQSFASRQ